MKNKMKTTEMEDFEILYKNIGNEVIKERIRSSGQLYIERSIRYKRYFYSLNDKLPENARTEQYTV